MAESLCVVCPRSPFFVNRPMPISVIRPISVAILQIWNRLLMLKSFLTRAQVIGCGPSHWCSIHLPTRHYLFYPLFSKYAVILQRIHYERSYFLISCLFLEIYSHHALPPFPAPECGRLNYYGSCFSLD